VTADTGPLPDGFVGVEGGPPPGDGLAADGAGTDACAPGPALLARVDPARMLADMKFLVGLGERMSHASQQKAAAYIKSELSKLAGVTVQEQGYTFKGLPYVNLEATVAGRELPDEVVMAGAHYDAMSENPAVAPGADDNASGTASVLEFARALSGCKPRRSVKLVFFSNEDVGLVGSQQYVASIKGSLPTNKLVGFIAVDMVAYGPDTEDLDLASRPPFKAFVDATAAAVEKHTSLPVKKLISDHCG
jgi:hypothetical protein